MKVKKTKRSGRNLKQKNTLLMVGSILAGFMVLLIVISFFWTHYQYHHHGCGEQVLSTYSGAPHGSDSYGRDIFSRILEGAGTSFLIAVCVVAIGTVAGILIGALTGYFGGWADEILMRICDSITAFPAILLALVIVAVVGGSKVTITWILGLLFIPSFARIVRGEYAKAKELNYVKSARLMGASSFRIMFRHILPNTIPVLLPAVTIGFNNAVLAEASMSYLGIGVQPPDASLGRMLSEAQIYLKNAPWYVLFVGLTMVLLILGFSMLGEGLQQRRR